MTSDPAALPPAALAELLKAATDLDLRGLHCPMPVLRTRRALVGSRSGDLLRVSCTDPLAGLDIPHLIQETGDTLIHAEHAGEAHVFLIRRS